MDLLSITPDTTSFPWDKRTPFQGFVSVIALATVLIAGRVTGHEAAGAIAASGAFIVAFATFHPVMGSKLWAMLFTTLGIASATLVGSLCAHSTALTLLVVAVAAINYAVLAHLTPSAGFIGLQCGVYAIVAGYFPGGIHFAAGRMAMILLGGTLQIILQLLFALRRNPEGVRRAVHQPILTRTNELLLLARTRTLFEPATLAYTARLLITLLLCTALYRYDHIRNGYWIPMTAILVIKPEWAYTLSRGIARLLGTVVAAAIALGIAHFLPFPHIVLGAGVLAFAFICYAVQAVNYALFSFALTLYIVFLFNFGGFSEHTAAHLRLLNTVIGGTVALTLDALWAALYPRLAPQSPVAPAPGAAV